MINPLSQKACNSINDNVHNAYLWAAEQSTQMTAKQKTKFMLSINDELDDETIIECTRGHDLQNGIVSVIPRTTDKAVDCMSVLEIKERYTRI